MVISKVLLKNFLCFYGEENIIEFKKGLNLILGGNGYGKTKLYDAFFWVFTDGITNQGGGFDFTKIIKDQLISQKALDETDKGKITCEVSIDLWKNDLEYRVVRQYSILKNNEGKIIPDTGSVGKIYKKTNTEFIPVETTDADSFNSYIQTNIIPFDKLDHIWFQGERGITKAVDTSNSKSLYKTVKNLSYIDHWEEYSRTAEQAHGSIKRIYDKEVRAQSKNAKETDRILNRINELQDERLNKKEQIANTSDEISRIGAATQLVNSNLKSHTRINELKRKKETLTEKYEAAKQELEDSINESDRQLFKGYWVIHGTEYLTNKFSDLHKDYTYQKQDELKAFKHDLPSIPYGNPKPMHIRKMLEDEHCHICDRPALKGSPHYESLERLLPKNYPRVEDLKDTYVHEEIFEELSKNLIRIETRKEDFQTDSDNAQLAYYQLEQTVNELKEALDKTIEEEDYLLKNLGIDSTEIIETEIAKYQQYFQDSQANSKRLGFLEKELERIDAEYIEESEKLEKISGDKINPQIKKYKAYFDDLLSAVKYGKDKEYERLVNMLEEQANKHYQNINKSSGAYEGTIKFERVGEEGYSSKIYNSNNEDRTSNMNTSQVLSMQLSILMAILSTNENKGLAKAYPLIADAPNSAFDYKKRAALLKEIAVTFDQSIMMMFEYLVDEPNRLNRYRIDMDAIAQLKRTFGNLGVGLNIIHLDIPDGVNVKKLGELSIQIKPIK